MTFFQKLPRLVAQPLLAVGCLFLLWKTSEPRVAVPHNPSVERHTLDSQRNRPVEFAIHSRREIFFSLIRGP